jgi:hypothetical protein
MKARFELFEDQKNTEVFYLKLTKLKTIQHFQIELCDKNGGWLQTILIFEGGRFSLPLLEEKYKQFFKTDENGSVAVDNSLLQGCNKDGE